MISKELASQEVQPRVHELSLIKQVMESRSHALDILREALSNMCTPEVGATTVKIHFYSDPKYGGTFIFEDDGCGMDYTGSEEEPGRLDRFVNLGYSGAAGLTTDKYGWKGLGSKLMLNCRRLELTTWTGKSTDSVFRVEVTDPRSKLLRDIPEWPKFYLTRRDPEADDYRGTTIKVFGFDGGQNRYSIEDLTHYLYWNTILGITRNDVQLPNVILGVDGEERELERGYRWIRPRLTDESETWKTVLVHPPIVVTKQAQSGESVTVTLKGGFTLNTGDACGPGISLSRWRGNTGLRLSVLGIPYFRLDFPGLKGSKFQQYQDLCSFVVECDELATKLNIDRSSYNRDDVIVQAFEKAVTEAFDRFAETEGYRDHVERTRKEDEKTKSAFLNERKKVLNASDQEYVVAVTPAERRVLHRVPNNEQDTLALFWKLEGLGLLPFAKFETLKHTNKNGIDVIANFQETEDSQLRLMEAVEFEHTFENFLAHGHNPKQTSLLVCWTVRSPKKLERVSPYTYRAKIGTDTLSVLEISKFPDIEVIPKGQLP